MLKGNQKTLGQSCSSFAMPMDTRLHMRALEPRILLDAAAVETAADALNEAVHVALADDFIQSNFPDSQTKPEQEPPQFADPLEVRDLQSQASQRSEIVFVAADIDDPTELLAALPSSTEVVFLSADRDGMSQIAETLSLRSEVDSIHILSHGSQGALSLGGDDLTSETMQSVYAAQLAMIGDALSQNGDILIYGCDFAGGEIGRKAVEEISRLTGADVAASDDLTGNAAQGGDWDLEVKSGDVETQEVETRASWAGILADVVLEEYSPDLTEVADAEEIGTTRSVGQTFQHDSGNGTYEVDKVEVVLRDTGGPAQTIRVTISLTFEGTPIGEGTFNSASITSNFAHYAIPLDSVAVLDDNQEYYITLSTDNPSETIETANSQDGNYTDGRYVKPDGGFKNQHDLYFKIIDSTNSDPIIQRTFFEGLGGFRLLFRDENSTSVGTVVATDADASDTLTFSLLTPAEFQTQYPSLPSNRSDDAAFFTIDPATGVLTFATAPNFENPLDDNGDNTYWVAVQVSDGNGGFDVLPIAVVIQDINDAPTATGGTISTQEDTAINLSAEFSYIDEDNDFAQTLTIQSFDLGGGSLVHSGGTVVNVGDTLNPTEISTLIFTPTLNSTDTVTIDYTANDNDLGTVVATLTINVTPVNDAPVITSHSGDAIVPVSYDENQTFVSTVTASDVDLPADTITYSITGGPDAASFVVNSTTGDLSFIAAPDFENPMDFNNNGIFRVIVTASDGNGGTADQQFTITLADVNEVPVATNNSVTTNEDVPYTFSVADFDYDDQENDALVSATLTNLSLAGGILTHSGGTAVNNGDTLTAAQINTLIYTPAANSSTNATFDFTVNDADLGTVSAVMTVQVDAVNDTPVATDTSITIQEDTSRVLDGQFNFTDVEGDPLQSVTIQFLSLAGGTLVYGSGITVNVGDTLNATDLSTLTFTPSLHSLSSAEIDFTVNDADLAIDSGTLTININPANDVPVATASSVTTNEDVPHAFTVADFGYTDVESDALVSITISDLDLMGGTLTHSGGTSVNNGDTLLVSQINSLIYNPAANSSANAAFDYTVNDVDAGTVSAEMSIQVDAVNDVPVATASSVTINEDVSHSFSVADFGYIDVESDALASVTISNLDLMGGTLTHSGGTAVNNGDTLTAAQVDTLIYSPFANSSANAAFDYIVNDTNAGIVAAVMTIQVDAVNDVPAATASSVTTNEDVPHTFSVADFGFTDVENDALVSITVSNLDLMGGILTHTGGTVVNTGDTLTAAQISTLIYSPSANSFADAAFDYVVNDADTGTVSATMTVQVDAVNDVPVATDSSVTTNEDVSHSFSVADFGYSDVESDALASATLTNLSLAGGTLTYSGGTSVNNGDTLTAAEINTLIYTPAANSSVDASFDYTANDANLGTVSAVMTVQVDAVNDAPVLLTGGAGAIWQINHAEGQVDVVDIDAVDPDLPAEILTYTIVGGVDADKFEIDGNTGVLSLLNVPDFENPHDFNADGDFRVIIEVSDGNGGTDTQDIRVLITDTNQSPVATGGLVSTDEDVSHVFTVADFGFSDDENDALASVTISNLDLMGGTLTHSGGTTVNNGDTLTAAQIDTLIYAPAANSSANAAFDYVVNDADTGTVSAAMTVQVDAVNDVPVATASSVTTNEDVAHAFSVADFSYIDVESDALVSVTISNLDLMGGTLTHSGGTTVNNGDTLTAVQIDTLIYAPAANSFADAAFDYVVNDANTGVVSATMTVQVDEVNYLPVATGGTTNATEDVQHVIPVSAFNYTDAEGDSLQSITVSNLALSGGTLTHSGGTVTVYNGMTISAAELADLTFLSATNDFGNVSFDYSVNDDDMGVVSATLNINIAQVNDAPIATGGSATTDYDQPYTFQVSDFGYNDVEGDALQSIQIESLSLAGGQLTISGGSVVVTVGMVIDVDDVSTMVFTPAGDESKNAVIRYTVNDVDVGIVPGKFVVQVHGSINPGDVDPEKLVVEEETEEETEKEGEEETEEDVSETTSSGAIIEGTTSNPVVVKPPVLAPVAQVLEEAPATIAEDIDEIEDRRIPPVSQTEIVPPKDGYEPIPLANHTFEPVSRLAMLEEIDQSSQDVREYSEFLGADVAKVSFTFGSLLSIGGVSWLLRGGALMAAFLSVMPAWSRFDPVKIVTSRRDENEEKESSEFDVMLSQVKGARSRVKGIPQS